MSLTRSDYLAAVTLATSGYVRPAVAPFLTDVCPECRTPIAIVSEDHEVVNGYVAIGCEGFYVISPASLGFDFPNWEASERVRFVYYTADVVTPDGSDTGVYGDPCESGHGATLESGWLSPDWSRSEVCDNREDVTPDEFDAGFAESDDESPAEWLARTIIDRIGVPEDDGNAGNGSYYATDFETVDYATGVQVRPAAHPYGFTPEEIRQAEGIFSRKRAYR